ncbi:Bardet-Biedl syndrome 2 protein [Sarcoptes scabiei]|nr:Bardet-Biedl syndrome 2 protein [Sarcoptes scabiei]
MYRAHCQRILDAIVRANFDEIHRLIYHFWQQIPSHLVSVAHSHLLINLLGICDIRLYRTIIKIFSMTFVQPLSEIANNQLESFIMAFDSMLQASIPAENPLLLNIKQGLAKHFIGFVKCLLRHCRMFDSLQTQLLNDQESIQQFCSNWSMIDVHGICTKTIELYRKTRSPKMSNLVISSKLQEKVYGILLQYLTEFRLIIANMVDCSQLLDLFENIWNESLRFFNTESLRISRKLSNVEKFFRQFLMIWNLAKQQIIKELNHINNSNDGDHYFFSHITNLFSNHF